jgi:glucokinase
MPHKFAVGVDFGGTKTLVAVINLNNGQVSGLVKGRTGDFKGNEGVVKGISELIQQSIKSSGINRKNISGIGIGAAGQVDREKGILIAAANIGVHQLHLAKPLQEEFKMPCFVGNDVEVATLGELNFGAGRDCDDFVCIFVGTGVGSGIVNDGRLYRGASGTAGEIGHMVLNPKGRLCGCGAQGCLESYTSRTAIAKTIVGEIAHGRDSIVKDKIDMDKGVLRSKTLAEAIAAGDEVVTEAIISGAELMGMGLASVINFYNPKRIILGGGLIEAVPLYLDIAAVSARRQALRVPAGVVEIVKAKLGDYAGIIGAALMADPRQRAHHKSKAIVLLPSVKEVKKVVTLTVKKSLNSGARKSMKGSTKKVIKTIAKGAAKRLTKPGAKAKIVQAVAPKAKVVRAKSGKSAAKAVAKALTARPKTGKAKLAKPKAIKAKVVKPKKKVVKAKTKMVKAKPKQKLNQKPNQRPHKKTKPVAKKTKSVSQARHKAAKPKRPKLRVLQGRRA